MPAITSLIAKIMILVDAFLESFVTVSTATSVSNCGINQISGGLTPCGQEVIADRFREVAFDILVIGSDLLPFFVINTG